MNAQTVAEKIASLPEEVQKDLEDLIDMLVQQNTQQGATAPLTDAEKAELSRRLEAYRQDSSKASSLEEVKQKFAEKYGWQGLTSAF